MLSMKRGVTFTFSIWMSLAQKNYFPNGIVDVEAVNQDALVIVLLWDWVAERIIPE